MKVLVPLFEEGAKLVHFKEEEGTTRESMDLGSVGLCPELGPKWQGPSPTHPVYSFSRVILRARL